jgi:hypothetical protein
VTGKVRKFKVIALIADGTLRELVINRGACDVMSPALEPRQTA